MADVMSINDPRDPDLVDPLVDEERARERDNPEPERGQTEPGQVPPNPPFPPGTPDVPPPPSITPFDVNRA